MLTADPEGFPLGLAELGLKKPKAGGENTRVTMETESSPAHWPWLGSQTSRRRKRKTSDSQSAEGLRAVITDSLAPPT